MAVIFSSNNLDHLFAATDRIITLSQGTKTSDLRTDETNREEVVALLVGKVDRQRIPLAVWTFDSNYRSREQAERLRYHQMLLEKDLAAQDNLTSNW